MFSEYDSFRLCRPLQDGSIPVGTRGVVLMVLDADGRAYEVEFPDGKGGNLGSALTYTVTEDYMEPMDEPGS